MLSTQNREASTIVLGAIRKQLDAIESSIRSYHDDSSKIEDIDESIRRTRIAKCATAIIGSPTLNRLLSLQEDVLESIAIERRRLDDDVLSLLATMVSATTAYVDVQSSDESPSEDAIDESRGKLVSSVKAYRRYRNLPDSEDERAISDLFRGSRNLGQQPGLHESDATADSREVLSELNDTRQATIDDGAATCSSEFDEIAPELLEVFREEAEDHVNKIYAGLSQLEKNPHDRDKIQDVRRAAHTFKGAAGAVGLSELSRLSHRMEDVLDELYDGGVGLTPEHLALLLETTDVLQDCCLGENDSSETRQKIPRLYAAYDALGGDSDTSAGTAAEDPTEARDPGQDVAAPAQPDVPAGGETKKASSSRTLRVPASRLDDVCNVVGELMINRTLLEQIVERFLLCVDELQPVLDRLKTVSQQLETKYEVPALWSPSDAGSDWMRSGSPTEQTDEYAEFDELELDRYTDFHLLLRSLAEATSDTGAISHQLRTTIGDFQALLGQQSRLTRDAQSRLLQIRMVPFGSLASRLTRALREVADRQGKSVELVIEGENTELDKTVLEELLDPLLHLIRNSVDHGIETAAVRQANRKPELAHVRIRAFNQGTHVVIEIADDGKGLDAERIRAGVVRGGYLDVEAAKSLAPDELYPYIFIPGFSTAASVSEISGRGVGMDIVRCNIEKLKGLVEVQSCQGAGTTFTIRLPTTLVVTRALIAMTEHETFAIPTHAVAKIVRLGAEHIDSDQQESKVNIDGELYPLVRLDSHLEFTPVHKASDDMLTVALVRLEDGVVALTFDTILSTRDIVVKSLGSHLGHVPGLLGATLLGNGAVVPILDPAALSSTEPARQRPRYELSDWEWEDVSVMIVDDSVSVRRALSNLIQRAEWTPFTARDGLDALEIIGGLKQPPQVILLDVEMPRMDGYELLSTLRGKPEFARVPIIMITSRAGDKHRRKAFDLGATAYVVKPIQDEPLLQLIRRHVAQSKRQ